MLMSFAWTHFEQEIQVMKSQNMTDEAPEEDEARSDWIYLLPINCFGYQSYKYIR